MSSGRRITDDTIREALAVSPRAHAGPDLDAAIARAIRTTRQDRAPMLRWLGLAPEFTSPTVRVARLGFLLALLLALVGMALLVGALLRRPILPANGALDLIVNDQLVEVGVGGTGPRLILPADLAAGGPVWSPDGRHLAVWTRAGTTLPGKPVANRPSVTVLAANGALTATITTAQMALGGRAVSMDTGTISWAPDSTGFVFDGAVGGLSHLYRFDLAAGRVRDITPPGVSGHWPAWSPDGQWIALFAQLTGQDDRLWVMQADGSAVHAVGDPLPHGINAGSGFWPPQWSSDSARVAFDAVNGVNYALYVVDLGTGRQVQLGADLTGAFAPIWGPDPTQLAFENRNGSAPGKIDVYLGDPGVGSARLLVPNADLWGWSPDGSSLLIGSPSCWNDNRGMWDATQCHEDVFSVSLDRSIRRELVSAAQLERLAPMTSTTGTTGVNGAAWRPVRP